MSDSTVPLVISIISLVGTVLTTIIGAYITYYSEEHKARREANKILLKYRDPLLLAAVDLQARCWGICEYEVLDFKDRDVEGDEIYKDTLYIYTAYVVGQYLSWSWILRRQAQFVALVSSAPPKWSLFRKTRESAADLTAKIESIRSAFHTDTKDRAQEKPFLMFKAHQQLIGEIMSCQDATSREYYCMGFATFTAKWKNGDTGADPEQRGGIVHDDKDHAGERMAGVSKISDQAFRAHFKHIEDGINHLYAKRQEHIKSHPDIQRSDTHLRNQGSDGRLRRLQHLLLDLMDQLDPQGNVKNEKERSRAYAADGCEMHSLQQT